MKTEILIEMTKFSERLNQLSSEIIEAIKPNVIAKHSTTTEYGHSDNGSYSKQVQQEVKAINFNVWLTANYMTDLLTGEKQEQTSYKMWTTVYAGKSSISDGQVEAWVWKVLQTKINFDEFPNFEKPKFSDDGKQIMGASDLTAKL